ncbi:hypothetical protein HPB50_013325 [Hyalomma asiaticum]|uniref:Uncharacterized protein n=1 Tax=Hyalomma asiaticum TaxID=266040 RepID=A0ACB7TJV0_HYAAI|nr:hypothetical protein HPB50_013325 [Hyalomma asiaticum]
MILSPTVVQDLQSLVAMGTMSKIIAPSTAQGKRAGSLDACRVRVYVDKDGLAPSTGPQNEPPLRAGGSQGGDGRGGRSVKGSARPDAPPMRAAVGRPLLGWSVRPGALPAAVQVSLTAARHRHWASRARLPAGRAGRRDVQLAAAAAPSAGCRQQSPFL